MGIVLPAWESKHCLMGVGHRCVVSDELKKTGRVATTTMKAASDCVVYRLHVCFAHANTSVPSSPIFNFSVFVTGLTLLVVVFSITDAKFKFRVAVAPTPLIKLSVLVISLSGVLLLYSDLVFNLGWLVPKAANSDIFWQVAIGGLFFGLFLIWLFVGLLTPPKFSRLNAFKYGRALYRTILTGNDAEMVSIAQELARSSDRIVEICRSQRRNPNWGPYHNPTAFHARWARFRTSIWSTAMKVVGRERLQKILQLFPVGAPDHANTILYMIGERRFCYAVVSGSPSTAIAFFQALARTKKYDIPMGQFATHIAEEAILNSRSLLYQEHENWSSGLLGHWKPFSAAVFGNYELVHALGHQNGAPLDIGYFSRRDWTPEQFEAYTNVVLITFKSYCDGGHWREHSSVLIRAISSIAEEAGEHNWRLDTPLSGGEVDKEAAKKLQVGVRFLERLVEIVEKMPVQPRPLFMRPKKYRHDGDMYDEIASLAYALVLGASWVRSKQSAWSVQYSVVWGKIFGIGKKSDAWRIVQRKLIGLILKEVHGRFFNYVTSRLFGMLMSVVGFTHWQGEDTETAVVRRALIRWARKNLMTVYTGNPDVVEWGLPANLTVDGRLRRLIKTYDKNLSRKQKVIYLQLP